MTAMHRLSWTDISVPLGPATVTWPGDPPVTVRRVRDMAAGDRLTVSLVSLGSHAGTHVDAPRHFLPQGRGVDEMPLATAIGRARVIAVRDSTAVTVAELREHDIRRGERILLRTANSPAAWRGAGFAADSVTISDEAAQHLVDSGVRLVGIDYLSVGSDTAHRTLLGGGVWIIEGLDLTAVAPGDYHLVCLALKVARGDGAPARVMLGRG